MKFPTLRLKRTSIGHAIKRPVAVATALMAIVTLFLLAASLNNLEFEQGQSFVLPERQEGAPSSVIEFPPILFDLFLALLAVAFLVSLLIVLRSPRDRRRIAGQMGLMLLIMAIGLLISSLYRSEEELEVRTTPGARAPHPIGAQPAEPQSSGTTVPVAFAPPVVPGWVSYAVTLLVIGLAGALGYLVWQLTHTPKDRLHEITRSALDDLSAGRDWEDVVIRCYVDMSATVSRRRGVGRHQAMTPREFAVRLEQMGLPANSVGRLTRLFEQARYGNLKSGPDQVREATACLAEIMQAVEGH
jgi:multisubunit Na+/H+ antiporter MnhF subunit